MAVLVVLSLVMLATRVAGVEQAKATASDDLLDVVRSLKDEVAVLKRRSEDRERKYVELKNEVIELKRSSKNKELKYNELLKKYEDQDNAIKELKKTRDGQENVIGKLTRALQEQKASASRHVRERRSFRNVAFSVYLSQPQKHTKVGQTVKFDGVQLNEGAGYDPHLGRFVAPTRGLYMFAFTVAKYFAGEVRVNLMKNGDSISGAIADVRTDTDDHQAGNVVLVELDVGDVIYVENCVNNDIEIYGHPSYKWTTLTGVWLA